jgi:cold-inducible RNA-binding protein
VGFDERPKRSQSAGPTAPSVGCEPRNGTTYVPGREHGQARRCPISAKLFVGNLSFQTTREQLVELFGQVAPVVDAVIPTDRETGRSRGFAFVEYATETEAQQAIERFNGHELDGRPLRVNGAEARPPRPPRPFIPRGDDHGGGGGGGDFGNPFGGGRPVKAKGSRRHLRARKRGG